METSKPISLTSGQQDTTWSQYNLAEVPLLLNGEQTKYKAILQAGEIAQIATNQYHVLPNEEAIKIADETAKQMGLVPFDEFTGSWFQRLDDHVIRDGFKVHALYAHNEPARACIGRPYRRLRRRARYT